MVDNLLEVLVNRDAFDKHSQAKVHVRKDTTVDTLRNKVYEKIKDQYEYTFQAEDATLFYQLKRLENGKRLVDYEGLTDESVATLLLVLRAPGGSHRPLTPLPGRIKVTTSKDEPDMISLDDSPDKPRAKMPCGHVISPESMAQYCKDQLKKRNFTFKCPHDGCLAVWDYILVRHVSCLPAEEQSKIDVQLSRCYMLMSVGIRECPGCSTLCFRADQTNIRVHCPFCSKQNRTCYDFCWACLSVWKTGNTSVCGNTGCDGKDPRLRILKDAPLKTINIGKVIDKVPSIRACPKCGLLIEHKGGCRHMPCAVCNIKFCFICLKLGDCDIYSTCIVAPPQTSIVGA